MKIRNYKYVGRTYKNCDPSKAQKDALTNATNWRNIVQNSYTTVFGAGSQMLKAVSGGLDNIIAKGREAMGFSPEELAAKNSQAISSAAASSQAVQRSIGNRAAVSGAVPGVESGVVQAERAQADTSVMENLSNREANITDTGYQVQRDAFDNSVKAKESSVEKAFDPAAQVQGAVTQAGEVESQQANANAAASNSWMGLVGGLADSAVGGLAGGGFGKMFGGKKSGGGGSSSGGGSGDVPA